MKKIIILLFCIFLAHSIQADDDLESLEREFEGNDKTSISQNKAKYISIQDAIEIGLRTNLDEKLRVYQFQLNEIYYQDAFDDFYLPKLQLTMGTTSDHFAENLYRDPVTNASSAKTPTGFIGVGFKDYTLFNWGKDYLDYANAKNTYYRQKEKLSEERRELRLKVIFEYFNLSRLKNIVTIYKKQLSHTSFVYRLAKEKLSLKKIKVQEFLQAKAIFLKAHKEFHEANTAYYTAQESLAQVLGDDPGTVYVPTDNLKQVPLSINLGEIEKLAVKKNPKILDARYEVENAVRSHQKTLKENLPLPKFSVKLGTYKRLFSDSGYEDNYNTFDDSKNVEIAATLNMTWTLYGSGGFLNSRITESSFYKQRMAEIKMKDSIRESRVSNRLTLSRVQLLEKQFVAVEAELKNARYVFDKTIDNYISSKTTFVDLESVLTELLNSSVNFQNTKFEHLIEKLNLAKTIGIEDFPGEKFDRMVEK